MSEQDLIPDIVLPQDAEVASFSDSHLNLNRNHKNRFIKAIFAHPRINLFLINGDLADNQFGGPASIITANRDTFDRIRDNNVVYLEGNHDTFEWWDGTLDYFVPPEKQFSKLLMQVGSTLISAEHGNGIQPALHERVPWLPKSPLFGYIGLHGGTLLKMVLKDFFRMKATYLPDNTNIFNWAEDHLPTGVWGMYGHTHNPEVVERDAGGLLINTGSIGTIKAEYAILNEKGATNYTLHPEP